MNFRTINATSTDNAGTRSSAVNLKNLLHERGSDEVYRTHRRTRAYTMSVAWRGRRGKFPLPRWFLDRAENTRRSSAKGLIYPYKGNVPLWNLPAALRRMRKRR